MSPRVPSSAGCLATALAALVAAGPVRAGEPARGGSGALRISANPPRLVLGRDELAEIRVLAPPQVRELSLSANAGRVERVRRFRGGFAARYRPPAEHLPQVAIVSAIAHGPDGFEDAWLALPLSGEGDARVRGEPGTKITLRIADRTFGPRTAGPDGVAVIPVIVPPGVREAHHGFRPFDLEVPETQLLHAVQDRTRVRADREERIRVIAYVVAPHGAARRGDLPVFEPSRGAVSVVEREPGACEAVWTLPPGPEGEERLTIRLAAAPASRAVLRVEAAADAPALVAASSGGDAPAAPRGPALLLSAGVGVALDARARFAGPSASVVAQRPADLPFALRLAGEPSWRLEALGLGARGGDSLAAVLAGVGLRRRLPAGLEGEAGATAGALLGPGRAAMAARLSLSLGIPRRWGIPFVEASLLAAGAGAPGAFVAPGLSAGIRFELENRHADHPRRR